MKYRNIKRIIAALAALMVLALAGCSATPDSKEDPLSMYDVDSMLPFATRVPDSATPTPAPTPTGTIDPLSQDWQNDDLPDSGNADYTDPASTPASYMRLEEGDESDSVLMLQQRLIQLGYLTGTADGKFGAQTKIAVKRFQDALGLSQTGIASVSLQEKLFLSGAPAYDGSTDITETTAPTARATARVTAAPTAKPAATDRRYGTLSQGSSGTDVQKLQARLIQLGYLSGTADGDYGSRTTSAVKRFQAALGLDETGIATGYLQEKIYASNAPEAAPTAVPTSAYVLLEPGDSGSHVKTLQARLKQLGYYTGEVDGNYYASTTSAIKLFQAALGLNQTGVATVAVQTKLFASNAPTYKPSSTTTPVPTPAGTGKYTYLAPGASGQQVVTLQNRLISLGFMSGTADGDYGSQTTAAVKRFQAAIGAETTGIATGYLQEKIFASTAPTYKPSATPTPTPAPTSSTNYVEMKPGDTGNRVKTLQSRLQELGYFTGNIGGNYLELTTAAVKRFQSAIGMDQTGIASVAMQQVLFSDDAPYYTDSSTTEYVDLGPGDSGSRVKRLQARLIELGYLDGSADGDYGGQTIAAIKVFQATIGEETTGKSSAALQQLLFSSSAPPYADSQSTQVPGVYTLLQEGDSGDEVKNLQKRLQQLGWFTGEDTDVDGVFDEETMLSVMSFQLAIGTADELVDGIATVELQEFLFSEEALLYAAFEDPQ